MTNSQRFCLRIGDEVLEILEEDKPINMYQLANFLESWLCDKLPGQKIQCWFMEEKSWRIDNEPKI